MHPYAGLRRRHGRNTLRRFYFVSAIGRGIDGALAKASTRKLPPTFRIARTLAAPTSRLLGHGLRAGGHRLFHEHYSPGAAGIALSYCCCDARRRAAALRPGRLDQARDRRVHAGTEREKSIACPRRRQLRWAASRRPRSALPANRDRRFA